MANNKTFEERLAKLEEKENELKEQKKKLKAQHAQQERKKRTRHLIEIGGIVYKILEREFVDGDIERLAKFLSDQNRRGGYFSRAMNDFPATTPAAETPKSENE